MEKAIPAITQDSKAIKENIYKLNILKFFVEKYQKCFYNSKMNYFKLPRYVSLLPKYLPIDVS